MPSNEKRLTLISETLRHLPTAQVAERGWLRAHPMTRALPSRSDPWILRVHAAQLANISVRLGISESSRRSHHDQSATYGVDGLIAGDVSLAFVAESRLRRSRKRTAPPRRLSVKATSSHAWAFAAGPTEPPVLDGKLDDRCWKRAAVIDRFASFWMNPPKSRPGTFAYLVWDDDALYYAGSMTDAELRSFGTKRNDHLWNGDVFELFLKPSAQRPEYYEFQANPRGVVFEAPFPKRGHDFGGFANAPVLGSKAAVALRERSTSPVTAMKAGASRAAFPGRRLSPRGGKPKPGAEWLFAICRYDYGKEGNRTRSP